MSSAAELPSYIVALLIAIPGLVFSTMTLWSQRRRPRKRQTRSRAHAELHAMKAQLGEALLAEDDAIHRCHAAEHAARMHEARFRDLLMHLVDSVAVFSLVDGELRLSALNRPLLDRSPNQAIGQALENAFPEIAGSKIGQDLQGVIRQGSEVHADRFELALFARTVVVNYAVFRLAGGDAALIIRDQSEFVARERKQAELQEGTRKNKLPSRSADVGGLIPRADTRYPSDTRVRAAKSCSSVSRLDAG